MEISNTAEKKKQPESSQNIAEEPVQNSAGPQHRHEPNGGHYQSVAKYKLKRLDDERLLVREACIEDAQRHNIPTNYCLKRWDPTEPPITLLGSVFDANSLGKWIFEWAICAGDADGADGADSDSAKTADDLWTLLIRTTGKLRVSRQWLNKHGGIESGERAYDVSTVKEVTELGERKMETLQILLRKCEGFMKGPNAGEAFVTSIFSHTHHGAETEELMESIRIWNLRWDVRCVKIVRYRF